MADVNNGDIVRTVLNQTWDAAVQVQNVAHLQCNELTGLTAEQALADCALLWDAVLDELEEFQSSDITYDNIYAFNETQDAPLGTTDVVGHENGSAVGQSLLPPQVASGFYGLTRASRVVGKKFFSGFTENSNDAEGQVTSNLLSAMADVAAIIWDATQSWNGHNWTGGIFRRVLGTMIPVVEAFVNNNWYTQRRRRRGVGA